MVSQIFYPIYFERVIHGANNSYDVEIECKGLPGQVR